MDKYNIIEPSNNLADLTNDYIAWCQLPFDIRMHANDSCIAMHGCTVVDLFNKYRLALMNKQAIEDVDDSNLVIATESYDFASNEDYLELLGTSKDLQKSPFIVIIDPDITSVEDLNIRYQSFNSLNDKNRRLSNDYSWQIWGYNVIGMYSIMMTILNPLENDKNNIVYAESLEKTIRSTKDFINRALIDNDIIAYEKYIAAFKSDTILENVFIENELSEYANDSYIDESIISKVVPWFTPDEQIRYGHFTGTKSDYIRTVKEAFSEYKTSPSIDTEKKIIELGWNPSVEINEANLKFAKSRQINFLENNIPKIVNISEYTINDDIESRKRTNFISKPLYFILGYPENFNQFANINHYNKAGISFNYNLNRIYTFDGVGSTFKGIKVDRLYNYHYIDIVVMYIDESIWTKLAAYCEKSDNLPNADFASVYDMLTNTVNDISPDNIKLIYAQYIDMMLRMASVDFTSHPVSYIGQICRLKGSSSIYKVYSGLAKDYNNEEALRVSAIAKALLNDESGENFIKENNIPDNIKSLFTAKSVIYEIDK